VHLYKVFRASIVRLLALLLLVALLVPAPAFSLDSVDSQIFISGFNAYQRKDYKSAIDNMSALLKKYPDTPLKDMAIFWLARANYKAGHQQEAAKYMAQFFREYPESPLKGTVEEGLVALAESYQKGEPVAQGAAEKAAVDKAAAEKVAAEKATAEKTAAEKMAADRLAAERAAAEKIAAEKRAAERAAAQKAAADRAAAEKLAAEKAAAERVAAAKAAAEKAAAEKLAAQKAAVKRAAAERAAAEKAAAERLAAERLAAERAAAQKAAADRAAAQKLAAEKAAAQKVAAEKAAADKAAKERAALQEKLAKSSEMRAKAVAAYKAVIDRYPGTAAAANASAKLRDIGVDYPALMAGVAPAAPSTPRQEVAQVFNLEVTQFADLDLRVGPTPETQEAGKQFSIPVEVVNKGNGTDRFALESGFPAEYGFHFAAAAAPDVAITTTPTLAVGETFHMLGVGTIPRSNIDGQKNSYPIKVASNFSKEVSQSKEIPLVTSAPLLRAVVKNDKAALRPGETVSYKISLLNIGTAAARGVTVRISYPPQYEPVGLPEGFKQENKSALVLESLDLVSGGSRDVNLGFRLKDEALAEQELFIRAEVVNNFLDKRESFVSATSVVQKVSGVSARTTADRVVVIPGQVVSIPIIVTNTGNAREVYAIKGDVPANASYTFFDDLNRDGKRQVNEPIINHVGPLSPKEEAYVILEIATPTTAGDTAVAPVSVRFQPEESAARSTAVHLQLSYSRPILELAMAAKGGRLKPGEVSSLELDCTNTGTNMAKRVILQSILPGQLELVAADPGYSRADNGVFVWKFDELGAGEKRSIKMSYRVKPGIAVGTNMQLKNLLNYEDQIGNRY
jgi:uncharacterized membrane protein